MGDARAPAKAPVGSLSARPVATAYRKTCPIVARSRFAVSSLPRDSTVRRTERISGAVISLIGRLLRVGEAKLKSHSALPTVTSALPPRRFLSTNSSAMAANVFSAALAFSILACFLASDGSTPFSSWRLLLPSGPRFLEADRRIDADRQQLLPVPKSVR